MRNHLRTQSLGSVVPGSKSSPALSAPGLIGPVSILNQPLSGPRSNRRSKNRPFAHLHLEVDLDPSVEKPTEGSPLVGKLEAFLQERKVTESTNLLLLSAATLHAFAARRFRWIDHWEVTPGGWLPLPESKRSVREDREPVGELLKALENAAPESVAQARTFAVRLSDLRGNRADVVVRRVHRPKGHALSIDLRGVWTTATLDDLTGSLKSRLPVARTTLTKFQYVTQ